MRAEALGLRQCLIFLVFFDDDIESEWMMPSETARRLNWQSMIGGTRGIKKAPRLKPRGEPGGWRMISILWNETK
jgi:hypothetical protein